MPPPLAVALWPTSPPRRRRPIRPTAIPPLLFDPADTKYVFRLNGTPWICRGDTFCKPIKIEGVADKDLAQAAIEPLGFAGPRYFLSYKQANFEKGKEVALSCSEERCSKLDSTVGDTSSLGTFQVKQGDRVVTRTALLRQVEAQNRRAQLLWCTENDCSELPLTRDAEQHLSYMGSGRKDGRTVSWLRDQSGAVLSCAQPEEGVSDQLACEKTQLVLSDFPAAAAPRAALRRRAVASTSDADRNALSAVDRSRHRERRLRRGRSAAGRRDAALCRQRGVAAAAAETRQGARRSRCRSCARPRRGG